MMDKRNLISKNIKPPGILYSPYFVQAHLRSYNNCYAYTKFYWKFRKHWKYMKKTSASGRRKTFLLRKFARVNPGGRIIF